MIFSTLRRVSGIALRAHAFAMAGALVGASLLAAAPAVAADPRYFDRGTPTLQDIWVDPVGGNDAASGNTRPQAVRTLVEAWSRVPMASTLAATGYRIRLVAGTYAPADVPGYFESRWGTFAYPVVIEAADGAGTALLPGLNIYDCRYLYLLGLHVSQGGGDVLHCEACDHFVMNAVTVRGADPATYAVQEAVKVNQSRHVYVEDSDVSGAWDNAIDFVAVQDGHLQGNRIHDAGDWCLYTKGGSAGLRIEGNELYDCGNGGYTAGQGTGFEFMTSPWLHYEAYDIRFVNNLVHDTDGAGMGVNGGYNILLAHNTLFRVGSISHVLELVFGGRSCDGDTAQCNANLAAGGWGTASGSEPIPNRNVLVYNNVFYNPAPYRSRWQQFTIAPPQATAPGSNIPSPAHTDTNARIRGNVVWNGPVGHALGIEGGAEGCPPSNPTCNEAQLVADNAFNSAEPQFVNAAAGNFQPLPAGNLYSATTYALPSFPGGDLPALPVVPPGPLSNSVTRDFTGAPRGTASPPGAFGADCSAASCGDGTATAGCEPCDDGNAVGGDGCDTNCTATACGNGVVTAGEQCDDGNLADGDGCDSTCALGCPASPSPSCTTSPRSRASSLRVVDAPGGDRDGLKWKLKGYAAASPAAYGNPTASTGYVLCLYETTTSTPSLVLEAAVPSAADCGAPGCWSASSGGYRFLDESSGRVDVRLRAKPTGLGDLQVATLGAAPFAVTLPLAQDPQVTAQLRGGGGSCWSASFAAPASRNDAAQFKDKAD